MANARMLVVLVISVLFGTIGTHAQSAPNVSPANNRSETDQSKTSALPDIRVPMDTSSKFCKGRVSWEDYSEYHMDLLRLAVRLSNANTKITPVCMDYPTEARRISMLQTGDQINTVFFGANNEREEKLLAAYVPVYLGTTGLRLFMLRAQSIDALDSVRTLDHLRTFSMGQGLGWPDSEILINNGFNVILGRYKTLHRMLSAERFDLYPRAYWQIAGEWSWMHEQAPGIVIHPGIALYYPLPIYFFVSPNYPELHEAIETGLKRAHSNGMMLDLIRSHFQTAPSFNQISLSDLHVLRIPNSQLSARSHEALRTYGLLD